MDLTIQGNVLPIEVVSDELSLQEYIQKKTFGTGREVCIILCSCVYTYVHVLHVEKSCVWVPWAEM